MSTKYTMDDLEMIARAITLNRAAVLEGNESRRAGWNKSSAEWVKLTGKRHPQGA